MKVKITFVEIESIGRHIALLAPEDSNIIGAEIGKAEDFNLMRGIHDISNHMRKITVFESKEAAVAASQIDADNDFYSVITCVDDDIWAVNAINLGEYDSGMPYISDKRSGAELEFSDFCKDFAAVIYEQVQHDPLYIEVGAPAPQPGF